MADSVILVAYTTLSVLNFLDSYTKCSSQVRRLYHTSFLFISMKLVVDSIIGGINLVFQILAF